MIFDTIMDALYQHRGCLISLRSFNAVPHLNSKPCHGSSIRNRGRCRRNVAVQAAYTAQLAATDLDPYTVGHHPGCELPHSGWRLCAGQFRYELMTALAVTYDGMLLLQDVEYNAQRNAVFWETRPVLVLRRTAEIGEHPCFSFLTGAPALRVLSASVFYVWCRISLQICFPAVVAFARWYLWIRLTRGTSIDSVSELQVCGEASQDLCGNTHLKLRISMICHS